MEGKDRAMLQNTEYAGMYWGMVYILTVFAFLVRAANDWKVARNHPPDWLDATMMGMGLLYCLIPLFLGLAFRRALKREMDRDLLSPRTFQICSFRIAMLLIFVYLGIMIFPIGK
jgi:predicted transporter